MRKLVSFMHVSLDGLIAGPKGEMDWITVDEEIFDYAGNRTNESDLALYGRVTYEMMESYWPTAADQPGASRHDIEHSTWYKKVAKVVLSRTLKGKSLPNTKIVSDNLATEIAQLKKTSGKEIVMFGSPGATQSLAQENLIDEYWLFVNPIILGQGAPFFKGIKQASKLKLKKSHAFSSGVVCLHYERI